MNTKPFFVLLFFGFLIVTFASKAIGDTDLTPDTPPAAAAAAAPATNNSAVAVNSGSSVCASSYTVRSGDTLSAIARSCAVTLAQILASNPSITNANLIRVGQVIAIPGGSQQQAAVAAAPTATTAPKAKPSPTAQPVVKQTSPTVDPELSGFIAGSQNNSGSPAASAQKSGQSQDSSVIGPGSLINISIPGLPANTLVSVGIGQVGKAPFFIDEEKTDGNGVLNIRMAIPASARKGQQWTVTAEVKDQPQIQATAVPFEITK